MSDTLQGVSGRGPISLEQLIALNDEILALTRAGMPLERGLVETGADLPGRLRSITTSVGERLSRGETLPDALAALGDGVPPVYRAVVEAGVRSGKLPFALEGLATYARGYSEARRTIGLALMYPVIVLTMAYGLFLFLLYFIIPKFEAVLKDFGVPVHGSLLVLGWISGKIPVLWPLLPLALVVLLGWWLSTRRAVSLQGGRAPGLLRWFPWMGRLMSGFEAASFADLLALLIEHGVPYPEALRLSGQASGNGAIVRSSGAVAAAIERGEEPSAGVRASHAFPPMLQWVIATGPRQGDLVSGLRHMAQRYRADARFQADKIRVLMPTFLMLAIGATATALYALALFGPLTTLWTSLSLPTH
jgi:type II secretory pathway component PulF